jgi:hypothetical protein
MRATFLSKTDFLVELGGDYSLSSLNRHLKDGTIKSVKLGSRVLIPVSEIDRLLDEAGTREEA